MPTSRSTTGPSKTNSKDKKKASWLSDFLGRRYVKPTLVVAAFMIVGSLTMIWAMAATTTSSLWGNAVPATLSSSDTSNIELGLRFKSNVAGYVTGVRFYKSAQNTGTHTGSLWDNRGKLLATVTFANESASGWQSANFDKPVSIASGTVYMVSYHAPNGHYSYNAKYFSRSAYTNGHLTAVRTSSSRPNGAYVVDKNSVAFPTANGNGTNYWVDVLFATSLISSQPAPAAPSNVTAVASNSTSVAVSWQASASANPIAKYIVYRDGNKLAEAGTATTYTDTTVTASNTYKYQVQAVDSTGVSSALSQATTVTTPTAPTTGSTTPPPTPVTSACPAYPSFPDASCTGTSGTLTEYSGPMEITQPGTVLKDVIVHTSMLTISADNVTLQNVKVVYNGNMNASWALVSVGDNVRGTVFDHTEIDGQDKVARGIAATSGFTVKNCNIHDTGNGVEADRNYIVQESYIWNIYTPDGQDWHSDGIQGWGDANDITIDHNTVLLTGGETGAVNFVGGASQSNNLVQHNLLAGGGYTVYVGSPTKNTNVRVIDNHLSTRYSPKVGQYGIWYYDLSQTPGVTRSGNVIHETGAPADADT